jgi:hypothetical protein
MEAHLRESLAVLRDASDDRALRRRIDDVLEGRASLRELARTPEFTAMVDSRIDRAVEEYDAIPQDVRDAGLQRALAEALTPPPDDARPGQPPAGTW